MSFSPPNMDHNNQPTFSNVNFGDAKVEASQDVKTFGFGNDVKVAEVDPATVETGNFQSVNIDIHF